MPDSGEHQVGEGTTSIDLSQAKIKAPPSMIATALVFVVVTAGSIYQAFALGSRGIETARATERLLRGNPDDPSSIGILEQVRANTAEIARRIKVVQRVDDHERRLSAIESTRYTRDDAQADRALLVEALANLQQEVVRQAASISATQEQILSRLQRLEDR